MPPIGFPRPNSDKGASLDNNSERASISDDTLALIIANDMGERASKANTEDGVAILYGAFVLVKTWTNGGCAIAIASPKVEVHQ